MWHRLLPAKIFIDSPSTKFFTLQKFLAIIIMVIKAPTSVSVAWRVVRVQGLSEKGPTEGVWEGKCNNSNRN